MTSGVPGQPDVYRNCDNRDFATDTQFYNYDYPIFVDEACERIEHGEDERLVLGALGLCGEAGEVAELIKKAIFHGKDLDEDRMKEEMGDVLWYFTLLMVEMGFDLDEIMQANIDKLRARYGPEHGQQFNSLKRTGCHGAGDGCHDVD